MKAIYTPDAPEAVGPYSQAIVSGGMLYTSGQIPLDPATGTMVEGDIEQQATRVMENLGAVLRAGGSDFQHAVKVNCYLSDMSLFADFNTVYARYFTTKPARSCVAVRELPKGALLEVEVVAETTTGNVMKL
ncbi:MAG: RidA family protein [Oscillospiraceae bacterium]|nr:RidA family protein [Oscillospiraceae bacterium]